MAIQNTNLAQASHAEQRDALRLNVTAAIKVRQRGVKAIRVIAHDIVNGVSRAVAA